MGRVSFPSSQEAFHVHVKVSLPACLSLCLSIDMCKWIYVYTHAPLIVLLNMSIIWKISSHTEVPNLQLPQADDERASIDKGLTDLTVGDTAPSVVTGGNLTVFTTTLSALWSSCPTDAQKQQVEVGNDNLVEMLNETDADLLASSSNKNTADEGDDGLGLWLVEAVGQSPPQGIGPLE